jgi:hypothetical protein
MSKTADKAIEIATRLSETRSGAVAFEQSHDAESEIYDDPVILYRSGELPPDFVSD